MLLLLTLLVVFDIAHVLRYLQLHAPTNVLIARVRVAPPRLRTAGGLTLYAATLLVAMHLLAEAIAAGAPGWLNLVVLVLAWDAIKTLLAGLLVVGRCVLRTPGRPRTSLAAPPPG
jgi:hypothetical protein